MVSVPTTISATGPSPKPSMFICFMPSDQPVITGRWCHLEKLVVIISISHFVWQCASRAVLFVYMFTTMHRVVCLFGSGRSGGEIVGVSWSVKLQVQVK